MASKAEAKALADAERHATEFRRKYKVSLDQWKLAEAMTADLSRKLLEGFWEVYNREHPRNVR